LGLKCASSSMDAWMSDSGTPCLDTAAKPRDMPASPDSRMGSFSQQRKRPDSRSSSLQIKGSNIDRTSKAGDYHSSRKVESSEGSIASGADFSRSHQILGTG